MDKIIEGYRIKVRYSYPDGTVSKMLWCHGKFYPTLNIALDAAEQMSRTSYYAEIKIIPLISEQAYNELLTNQNH